MTAPRNVAALASVVLLCAAAGCTSFYEIPIETPVQPKMDTSPFSRVFVAGFISGGTDDVDANLETVRLLRSQLRSKSTMRVIEAEVLPLADLARDHVKASPAANGSGPSVPTQLDPPPAQDPAAPVPGLPVEAEGAIRTEKDLERYQAIFADEAFWKKIGEEHQSPLIVTGTVLFTNTQSSGFVNSNREVIDPLGRRVVQPYRVYMERKGFIIEPRFIFIDGRTGAVLYSDRFHEEILYPAQQNTPALSSYFELMDRLLPSFLGSLSTQRIRGTRVLLR
ncbi:MAG: hypothetical protein H0U94_08020 [Acidobacteria bacterium]|nr:hypothetical protein [Acidobacteriota bacterium]